MAKTAQMGMLVLPDWPVHTSQVGGRPSRVEMDKMAVAVRVVAVLEAEAANLQLLFRELAAGAVVVEEAAKAGKAARVDMAEVDLLEFMLRLMGPIASSTIAICLPGTQALEEVQDSAAQAAREVWAWGAR